MRFLGLPIGTKAGLDTRWREWNRRYYAVFDQDRKIKLIVQANVYFPNCFNWVKLEKLGWFVHVMGSEIKKGDQANG